MKKKTILHHLVPLFLLLRLPLLLTSCATADPALVLTGEVNAKWELVIDENNRAAMTLPYAQSVVIRGEAFPEDKGEWVFYTDELAWFGNWEKGWTEARFTLIGSIRLKPSGDSWELEIFEEPQIQGVKEGTIRYGDTKYYGDRARDLINRRWTRIEAAARFAQEKYPGEDYFSAETREEMESLLFPEVYGFPPDCPEPQTDSNGERYERAEHYLWDRDYSTQYIPEELRPVRNTGTLYRDYQEGRGLFELALTWEQFWKKEL